MILKKICNMRGIEYRLNQVGMSSVKHNHSHILHTLRVEKKLQYAYDCGHVDYVCLVP